ncbi:MAG: hypothetical protein EOO29_23840, partial [Comamonadaceae bacterium]
MPLSACALGLGTPQGSAWIGQPLDLRVPLMLDSGDAGALCAQAELRQGEAGHGSTAVRAAVEPGTAPDRPHLRVRSTRPIEEPVLQLRVSVGCQGSTVREYVLLADPPPVLAAVLPPAARVGPESGSATRREAPAASATTRPAVRNGATAAAGSAARSPRSAPGARPGASADAGMGAAAGAGSASAGRTPQ